MIGRLRIRAKVLRPEPSSQIRPSAHFSHSEARHGATTEGALGSRMGLPITELPCTSRAEHMSTAADLHPSRAVEADPALERIRYAGLAAYLGRSSAFKIKLSWRIMMPQLLGAPDPESTWSQTFHRSPSSGSFDKAVSGN